MAQPAVKWTCARAISSNYRAMKRYWIFVLDRGAILRFLPSGHPVGLDEKSNPTWFNAELSNGNLLAFIDSLMRFGRGIEYIQNPLAPYMQGSILTGKTSETGYGRSRRGDAISTDLWDVLRRAYNALANATCLDRGLADEASRRAQTVTSCVDGQFPPEIFGLQVVGGENIPVSGELLDEINYHVRHMVGKDPALSPSPRADVPFQLESKVLGKAIEVTFKGDFIAELQTWAEEN